MELDKGYYGSPRWSWELLDCAMPMTFDTYSNCAHQCVYCFAFFQRSLGNAAHDYLHHRVKAVNVEKVKRMFLEPDEYAGSFAPYIKQRFVLQWGGLSDGFDWYEKKFGKSLELLRFFREIDYPVSISTKGTWFLDEPEYVKVIEGSTNTHWKYSIITTNEEHAKQLEAGTPPPLERLRALKRLHDMGVGAVTLRFRPFVLGISDLTIEDMFARAAAAGCYSVTTEFLCIEKRASANHHERYNAMSKVVGYDLFDFYVRNSFSGSGLMRLNYDLKRPYMERMRKAAAEFGLQFFVSDAHHKEQSAAAGCCGLPADGPLSRYNKGQFAEAILIAKRNGSVRWSDISPDAEWMTAISYWKDSGNFNSGSTPNRAHRRFDTMFDYMREMWNKPASWASPARYFGGVLVPSGNDENGDIIYLYNQPFVDDGIRVESVDDLRLQLAHSRDAISVDGGSMGHVAYPVYVAATGPGSKTAEILEESRVPFNLFCPAEFVESYQLRFPAAEVLAYSGDVTRLGGTGDVELRAGVFSHAQGEGYSYIWLLAGDIDGFYRQGVAGGFTPCNARALLSGIEGQFSDMREPSAIMQTPTFSAGTLDKDAGRVTCILWNIYGDMSKRTAFATADGYAAIINETAEITTGAA